MRGGGERVFGKRAMDVFEPWKPVVGMLAVNFSFAVLNILVKKVLNEGVNHMVIVTYRQSIATIFLIPIAYFLERKNRTKLSALLLCHLFVSALFGGTLTQYFIFLGLKLTSATFTCAFINTVPVITFILALPFRLERINMKSSYGKAKVLGTLICIAGALVLMLYKGIPLTNRQETPEHEAGRRDHSTRSWVVGSMFLTIGSLLWASWFLLQARISKTYPFQYSTTAIMSFFSAIQSVILTSIVDRDISGWILKGKLEILCVIYAGMVGSGLCYVMMSWCVKKRGPLFTAAFSPFTQIFVAAFDVSILHEQIHLGSILGSILVITGLYILLWGKSNEAVTKNAQGVEEDGDCSMPVTANNPNKT